MPLPHSHLDKPYAEGGTLSLERVALFGSDEWLYFFYLW